MLQENDPTPTSEILTEQQRILYNEHVLDVASGVVIAFIFIFFFVLVFIVLAIHWIDRRR